MTVENEIPAEDRRMQLSLIVAVARNGVIGVNGRLPMRLPADLRRFRIITSNKPVIMGRKTHDSIGKTLPNRTNIVLSQDIIYPVHEGSILVPGITQAYQAALDTGASHTFVIGGGQIFRYFLPLADKIYLTVIDEEFEGDTFFPVPVEAMLKWDGRLIQTFEKSANNAAKHLFYILNVPDVEELANYYEESPYEGTYATA
jgi:dihydrofolate reductase